LPHTTLIQARTTVTAAQHLFPCKPLLYFLSSANTPLHVTMAPEWYKLLALVVIIFSLVILTYDIACVIPTVHIVVAAVWGINSSHREHILTLYRA
jgi:hypothetical protein